MENHYNDPEIACIAEAARATKAEMALGSDVGTFVVILSYAIILFLLVRPGSQGPKLVSGIANGTEGIIKASTGGGTWSSA